MFNPQNETHSAVKHGQLVQSTLAYLPALSHECTEPDQFAREARPHSPARARLWIWLVLTILIGLSAVLVIAG